MAAPGATSKAGLPNAITIGRVAGIAVSIHPSWLLVAGLVAWSLAAGYFPNRFPGWATPIYGVAGVIAAALFFASVLLHELAHSVVARMRGVTVRGITLFIFGGVAQMAGEAKRPLDDFLIAAAGPATSFALAASFWLGHTLAPESSPTAAVLGYLAFANALLGGFNLLPGFPLDGGRVLRAALWAITRSLRRATEIASYAGQAIGMLMVTWGVMRLLGNDSLGGMWIAMLGLFLNGAAAATRREYELRAQLHAVGVADIADRRVSPATPSMSVEEFVFMHALRRGRRALPIVDDGQLVGIVTLSDVKELPHAAWATTPVTDIMTRAPLKTVSPDTRLDTALQLLTESDVHQLPVVEDGRLAGMVSRADLLRVLAVRKEIGERVTEAAVPTAPNVSGTPPVEHPRRAA